MKKESIYLNFLREKGRPLSEINPGSEEVALNVDDALQALNLLGVDQVVILGGDILSEKENGSLVYAYQLWGSEYACLDWYCDKLVNESQEDYAKRSYNSAKKGIKTANDIAKRLGKNAILLL